MTQIGIVLDQSAYNMAPQDLVGAVKRIEHLGYESVWLLDPFSRDPFVTASFILANTTKLKVGTGIATVYSRDAMAAEQVREALSHYYPDRFLMGLGASNEAIVQMRGGTWTPPVTKMRTYLEAMDSTVLAHPKPEKLAELHIAAHAPGLQNLAMKHANGIITWILPVDSIRTAREHVGADLQITANFPCVVSDDKAEARKVARQFMEFYIGIDYYQRAYSAVCFESADFDNGGSDRLIDAIVASGTPAQIKARVDAYAQAGATRVVLNPIRAASKPIESPIAGLEREGYADADLASLDKLAAVLF